MQPKEHGSQQSYQEANLRPERREDFYQYEVWQSKPKSYAFANAHCKTNGLGSWWS